MDPLFELPPSVLATAQPRWVMLVATLDLSGRVVAVQTDAITFEGARVASRGWFPLPDQLGHHSPLRAILKLADELTRDS